MREILNVTKALADENRIRILAFLGGKELCVCQIIEMLALAPSTVSKHLAILQQAGLVESRKDGRWVYYRLPDEGGSACALDAVKWLHRHLAKDPQVVEDAKMLRAVCRMDKDELCTCYKTQGENPVKVTMGTGARQARGNHHRENTAVRKAAHRN